MKSSGSNRTLLLAMVVAAAAAVAAYMFVGSSKEPAPAALPAPTQVPSTSVLVAKQDLAANTVLTAEMLEVKQVPTDTKNERALTNPDQAVGKVASVALMRGEQLLDLRLEDQAKAPETFAYAVPMGMRAVSIDFTEVIGSGGLVQPGDRVDVIGFFEIEIKAPKDNASAPANGGVTVNVEEANLLEEPDAEAAVVSTVKQGDELVIIGAQDTFFRVRAGDEEGWIDATAVKLGPGDAMSGKLETIDEPKVVTYIVQDVEVLAVAQALSPDENGVEGAKPPAPTAEAEAAGEDAAPAAEDAKPVARPAAKSATLAVSPEQAPRLLLAGGTAETIRLALRAPGDTTISSLPPAEAGAIPIGNAMDAVSLPRVPTELVITHAEFTKRLLNSGEMLDFKVTVKNVSDRTIRSAKDAPPEFTYTQGVAYDELGFFPEPDTYRIGLNVAGASPTPFPYRWSLGRDLEPGQTLDLAGSVQLTEATQGTRYWFGVILEDDVVVQDGVGVADVTVLASSALTVKDMTAQLRKDPNAVSDVVGDVEQGQELTVVDARGAWFRVRVGDDEGWIPAASVEAEPAITAGEPTTPAGDPKLVAKRIRERFDPWNRENN